MKGNLLGLIDTWPFTDWETFFALTDGEKVIGMATVLKEDYYPMPEVYPWVSSLFVSKGYRRRRLSGMLIDSANAYLKEQGFDRSYIPSIQTGLYEKYGYRYVRDIVNYGGDTDRLYMKELSGGCMMNDMMDKELYSEIKAVLESARNKVYTTANSAMVLAYWNIGRLLYDACGENERSAYGMRLLETIAKKLAEDYGKGYNVRNLQMMRKFYCTFPIANALRSQLSWTQYRMLIRVDNARAREFYIDECIKANWSSRQLERQINSFYYERLLSSRDKDVVRNEIVSQETNKKPEDVIHDPYVLDFLGLKERDNYLEKELEQALIDKLQTFLLELGRGFSFVARQKHIDLDGEHFYIDLVFYNYLLKCFVLIDLKTDKLTYQDIGQMDSYVRIFDEKQRGLDDNPTIGIILCSEKNKAIARYSILNDSKQVFASKYQLTLPTEDELRRYIEEERDRLEEEAQI